MNEKVYVITRKIEYEDHTEMVLCGASVNRIRAELRFNEIRDNSIFDRGDFELSEVDLV